MRGQGPPGYLALSLCTSFEIDVLLFANVCWLSIEFLGAEDLVAAPKWWARIARNTLAHKVDRFLLNSSDGSGRFWFGPVSGVTE